MKGKPKKNIVARHEVYRDELTQHFVCVQLSCAFEGPLEKAVKHASSTQFQIKDA